jgi:tetratricopeptide (TPR) repeat protein
MLEEDQLGSVVFAAIERHIEECPGCQARLESLAQECPSPASSALGSFPEAEEFPRIPGFSIESEIGRGSMGAVYLAWDQTVGRQVALKVMQAVPGADSPVRNRWRKEATAFSRVRHPNIVVLHDIGEAHSWLYLVLEYIPGRTLKDRLPGPSRPREVAGLVATVADAVHQIHKAGLLHLDLKPSNILLDAEPGAPLAQTTPKLADFGIARFLSDRDCGAGASSCEGSWHGTPSYMPPEQAAGDRSAIGPAADIYGLGALLYHLLTGRPPFSAPSAAETLDQVRNKEPVSPRWLIPQIPRDLETIALKCLEKRAPARYASAEALAGDLRSWLDGRPISARPVSWLDKSWRWCRRRPMIAALAAALALVCAIGFIAVVLLWRDAEAERSRARDELRFAGLTLNEVATLPVGSRQLMVLPRDSFIAVLQGTRHHLLQLRTGRPDDLLTRYQLAQVDIYLAGQFADQGRLDESRSAVAECLENVDRVLRQDPRDWTAHCLRFRAYRTLGKVADQEGNTEESLGHLERAVLHGRECLRLKRCPNAIKDLAECRWALAQAVCRRGDEQTARSLLVENLCMLEDFPRDDTDPTLPIWRILVRLDLEDCTEGSRSAPAVRSNETDPRSRLACSEADALDADGWSDLVVQSLASNPGIADLPQPVVSRFVDHLIERIAAHRRAGRIAAALRATGRMHAFARLMVTRYPERSISHLALALSFAQIAKNAWQTDDRATVARNWKLALDEASRAALLDPRDARAAHEVAQLRNRLDRLASPQPEAGEQVRSARTSCNAG